MDKLMILFPSNPLDSHKPDVDYQEEYQVAKQIVKVALIDNLELFENQKIKFFPQIQPGYKVLYRGWMLTPEQYEKLEMMVKSCKSSLITTINDYCEAHLLPNWAEKNGSIHD